MIRLAAALAAVVALAACGKRPEPAPTPTPAPSPAPVPTAEPGFAGTGTPLPASGPERVIEAPNAVNLEPEEEENRLVKDEVLTRIDAMPKLTPEEKDKLYVQVERARGMGKVITIPFASGRSTIEAKDIASLRQTVALPQVRELSDDPTVVFIILGFADKKGNPATNQAISLERAESVASALKNHCGILNVVHAVGMGSSEIFDASNLDKNRVVEVWAVLP